MFLCLQSLNVLYALHDQKEIITPLRGDDASIQQAPAGKVRCKTASQRCQQP